MPFVKRLTRIGSSTGIIIDRPVLRQVDLTEDAEVEVSVENDAIVIRPHRYATDDDVKASADRMAARHRKSLERLSR